MSEWHERAATSPFEPATPMDFVRPSVFGFRNPAWLVSIGVPHLLLAVALLIVVLPADPHPLAFAFAAIAAFIWFVESFLYGYQVEVTADQMFVWKSAYRRRSVPMADVLGSRTGPFDFGGTRPILSIAGRGSMRVLATGPGWRQFVATFNHVRGEPVLEDHSKQATEPLSRAGAAVLGRGYYEKR